MSNPAPTNQQIAEDQGKPGLGKIGAGILSGFLTTFIMNQASLHGVDFTVEGIPSEVVKSGLDGALIGFFVTLTPQHFVASVADSIIFVKRSLRSWRDAWVNNE